MQKLVRIVQLSSLEPTEEAKNVSNVMLDTDLPHAKYKVSNLKSLETTLLSMRTLKYCLR